MENYEQKYKESLSWMKALYPTLEGSMKEDAEHYFPELRESEDERIRKELIETIRWIKEGRFPTAVQIQKSSSWIAWIEKQGEQKAADIPEDFERLVEHLLSLSDGEGHGSPAKVKEVSSELLRLANQQKTAWSEEDEYMFKRFIDLIPQCMTAHGYNEMFDWLKSLKERMKGE